MSRVASPDDAEVWTICAVHFDPRSEKAAIGHGVGRASVVFITGLSVEGDGRPYRQHANIVAWEQVSRSADQPLKDVWMDKARVMSGEFKYFARTSAPERPGVSR